MFVLTRDSKSPVMPCFYMAPQSEALSHSRWPNTLSARYMVLNFRQISRWGDSIQGTENNKKNPNMKIKLLSLVKVYFLHYYK